MNRSSTFIKTLLICLSLISMGVFAAQDVKRPEKVFLYTTTVSDNQLIVNWDIEDGYYLYRDKMAYTTDTKGVTLGEPVYTAGEIHSDEFFGEQIIFRNTARVAIPIFNKPNGTSKIKLHIKSQGCADFGLCYPPQKWTTEIRVPSTPIIDLRPVLPVATKSRAMAGAPLPVTEAFRPSINTTDPFTLEIWWDIEPGYYLYRDSFAFRLPGEEAQLGAARFPPGIMEMDVEFGETEVYYNTVVIRLPLSRPKPEALLVELEVDYQGCKKESICYPPETLLMAVDLPRATSEDFQARDIAPISEQSRLIKVISESSLFGLMSVFLGLGLLLSLTPCCLPMVPILSGIIAGQGENITTARAFWLSLSYVLGMAFTYTIAGAIFGAAGTQISAALQTPLVIGGVSVLFIGLALAMFGLYELQVPAALQTRLTAIGNNQKAGSFFGVAFMGAISALVVSTCVAPPLVAALTVIAQTGDVTRGALALFAMAIGMGIPLLIIGTSAGNLLPKAGAWMETIKAAFGFMMLGLAIWMMSRLLPASITMGLYATLSLGAGIRFGALTSLPSPATSISILGKVIAVVILIYGGALVVGLLSGSTNPLQPLDHISGTPATTHLEFERIKSVEDFETARQRAATTGAPLMLDFYADWCVSCKEMEHYTFTNPRVQQALEQAILIQADVTANDEVDQALLAHFGVFGPPTIVFFDRGGKEIPDTRIVGYQNANEFLQHLDYVLQ
ncbi:MAG: protein-disulfide reductase DsbD [Gammaproteobacteria bacterium]|nr:protein-disulfide reductase DsbD [Gammaproteobacteria bacterium]MCP4830857.1 protein-disulfide reductase DsbD [Gammaproteobacteria bacterium]